MRRLLLGACLCALLSTPAMAQVVRVRVNAPAAPTVRTQVRWQWDSDDRVYYTTDSDLSYDAFRYGQYYYIYNDGYWYRAASWNPNVDFEPVDEASVPRVLFNIPETRYQWRSSRPVYGAGRYDQNNDGQYDRSSGGYDRTSGGYDRNDNTNYRYVQVQPRWQYLPSGQIYVAVNPDRNYDMYRSGSWYYLEDNGTWYRSGSWNGPYAMVEMGSVPRVVYMTNRNGYNGGINPGGTLYGSAPVVRTHPRWRYNRDRVYVAVNADRDYDMYRFGGWYYLNSNGTWYRASHWNGPYAAIAQSSVPEVVFTVTNSNGRDWRHDNRRRY